MKSSTAWRQCSRNRAASVRSRTESDEAPIESVNDAPKGWGSANRRGGREDRAAAVVRMVGRQGRNRPTLTRRSAQISHRLASAWFFARSGGATEPEAFCPTRHRPRWARHWARVRTGGGSPDEQSSPGPSRVWLMSAREVRRWSRQSRSASSGRAWQCGTAATRARRPFASRRTACRCSCGRRSRTSYTNPLATKD